MTTNDTIWYRLDLLVEEDSAVDAASILWDQGAAGVEVQDRQTYADDETITPVPEGTNRLVAYFEGAEPDEEEELEAEVVAALTDAEITPLSIACAPYTDRSWETAWKDFFHPIELSERSVVGPPWEEFEAPGGGTKLLIEPGMAFGTGTHETTQLCAEMLDEWLAEADEPPTLLDVGCGSAILSMLAARLGAKKIVGVDVDETAVEVARENLRVNDLEGAIDLSTTPVGDLEETFDVVVANILAPVLLHICEPLKAVVAPGGRLLMSGIDKDQIDDIERAFRAPDFRKLETRQKSDWIAIAYRREDR